MQQTLKESDLYEIDEHGDIYCKSNGKKINRHSTQVVLNNKDGWRKTYYIKNIIANNFHENPNNYKKIIQIDGDKNNFHPFRVGRKQGKAVLDSKGIEVVFFNNSKEQAQLYCDYLNNKL